LSAPDLKCSLCRGTGLVEEEPSPPHPPSYRRCACVLRQDIISNVERGLVGLSKAPTIDASPLLDKHTQNLWVTAGTEFLSHLRHVAVRRPAVWAFRVISDAELVTAWLATVAFSGEVIDPDAYMVSTKYLSIPDLVVPPDLVVLRMGVKVARNEASPEVLAEAINTRTHEGKATWLWDEPAHPLNVGHLFWSSGVGRVLTGWEHITSLAPTTPKTPKKKTDSSKKSPNRGRKTLRRGGS